MSENEVPLKKCSKCGILQVFDNFHRDRTKADGCATVCKTCVSHKKKQYYVEHKEASNEKDRAYYVAHAEQRIAEAKQYRIENSEQILKQKREYYIQNSKEILERERQFRLNKREEYLLRKARERAKRLGLDFDLTKEDIVIPDVCPVLGIPFVSGSAGFYDNTPTVDRLIPELGYVKGNINVISWRANHIKTDSTVEELRAVANWFEERMKEKNLAS